MDRLKALQSVKSVDQLAILLHYKPNALRYILYGQKREEKYHEFKVPKRNGGERTIHAPDEELKQLQRNLSVLMQDCLGELLEAKGIKNDQVVHGFTRDRSILTNAQRHRNQRWILNIDLKDFFPTVNFGRIRGFLMKHRDFQLVEPVATVIATIACHDGVLPQGSPCSPVFANLIAQVLDVRILKLVHRVGCRYSRYADDLTFSTSRRKFPSELATMAPAEEGKPHVWIPGNDLREIIVGAGFVINDSKTNMMYKESRQEVTGIVANRELRPRTEYRKLVRAMVHRYVTTGTFDIAKFVEKDGVRVLEKQPGHPNVLHGMLGFIDYVRFWSDKLRAESDKKRTEEEEKQRKAGLRNVLSSEEETYRAFLIYKLFYAAEQPTILCEGETDIIYLKCAIRRLAAQFPALAKVDGSGKVEHLVRFYRFPKSSTRRLLDFNDGGSGILGNFMHSYRKTVEKVRFKGPGLEQPLIVLFDDDQGGHSIRNVIGNITKKDRGEQYEFINVVENLYAVPTPGKDSYIEKFFGEETLRTELGGKTFCLKNNCDDPKHYGKMKFAQDVIVPNESTIEFSGFVPLLQNLSKAIEAHREAQDNPGADTPDA